jgi:hypothetical protein
MTANTSGGYLARVQAIVPGARTAKHIYSARNSKRDTIEDARKKVADKLRANGAWVLGMASADKPDLVYKEQADGTYAVGVKYGNRYLEDIFDGESYLTGVSKDKLAELLEMLAGDAEAGMFDTQIGTVMRANVGARNKH